MSRSIPSFDFASFVVNDLISLGNPPSLEDPTALTDLYDFVPALTNEYQLFKDLVPEIDPQKILHNSIDFIYDRHAFVMWVRN
mmetsp:Transcript_14457/g.2372  ORF Transcript_14457/g.2372 Transcript_14457/m.2372 type:complete len:83 (+) Transcript_14457:186-434(+)